MKQLRPYQTAAKVSLWQWLNTTPGNPLIVAPVGAGKSLMMADMIKDVHDHYPRTRIIVLAHVKELLEQNAEELRECYPTADYDFYCNGLGRKRLHNDITFASIQSFANKVALLNRPAEIVMIDECHLISHNDATQYRKCIDAMRAMNPNVKIIGYTGSAYRADTGRLDDGDGKIFDGIAYEIPIGWMMDEGYLVKPFVPDIKTHFNVEGVKTRAGDYIAGQLQAAVDIDEVTKSCVAEVVAFAGDRKRWFGMTAGVLHCTHTRDAFKALGVDCEMITGETPDVERKAIIRWFKEVPQPGEPARCLVNVGTMNVGFNAIYIDLLFPMRPTRSPVLYTQYTGRGLRPVYADGFDLSTKYGRLASIAASCKPNVMFLDFGNIVRELGPIDAIHISKVHKKKEDDETGEAPFKVCPSCAAICATAQKVCYTDMGGGLVCGYHFAAFSVDKKANIEAPILSKEVIVKTHRVMHVQYLKHWKGGSEESARALNAPPTMRVIYTTMESSFSEYICFEHEGFVRSKAERWFISRVGDKMIPATVDDVIGYYAGGYKSPSTGRQLGCIFPAPKTISVRRNGKFDEIVDADFSPLTEEELEAEKPKVQDDPYAWEFDDIPF